MPHHDPLAIALAHKARTGVRGRVDGTVLARGEGWQVVDVVCTSGPHDRPFEERQALASISLVLSGTFVYRSERGSSLFSVGALVLGNAGDPFEVSHQHGEGDRCLSFQFDPELFRHVAHDAGAPGFAFDRHRLPPLRPLASLTSRAERAMAAADSFEEIALALAGAVARTTARTRRDARTPTTRDAGRVARVLRHLETRTAEPHTVAGLAHLAGMSRYHFLRTFKLVTGVTPHQWLLRSRLRDAARRLAASRDPITAVALDVGFQDLSNFVRTFRAEFGVSPGRYRAGAYPASTSALSPA